MQTDRRLTMDENYVVDVGSLGNEFAAGTETHGKVTLRLGPGLYRNTAGEVCATPSWIGTTFQRAMAAVIVAAALVIGIVISRTVDTAEYVISHGLVAGIWFALGWWVSARR